MKNVQISFIEHCVIAMLSTKYMLTSRPFIEYLSNIENFRMNEVLTNTLFLISLLKSISVQDTSSVDAEMEKIFLPYD